VIPNLIVPVLNRYDLLRGMLASLDYPIRDLLIIDNGGGFEDLFERDELPVKNVRVLNLPSNLGVAASWNLGIKLFPHDDRWMFASNDCVFAPGALGVLSTATQDALTVVKDWPHWQAFVIGERVIDRVGLFDERFYPAYFEDTDFKRRCDMAGIPTAVSPARVHHANSSTLKSDTRFQQRNKVTFELNKKLNTNKTAGNMMNWSWSLADRRAKEWLPVD